MLGNAQLPTFKLFHTTLQINNTLLLIIIFISLNKNLISSKRLHKDDHFEALIQISIANTSLEKSPHLSGILSSLWLLRKQNKCVQTSR